MFKAGVRLLIVVLIILTLAGCTAGGQVPQTVTVREVLQNPTAFEGQRVKIEGYGTIMATYPLCPGYVGLDTRRKFVDANDDLITATLGEQVSESDVIHQGEALRTFEGIVRVFNGEIGCPDRIRTERIPYLEIVGVTE